MSTCNCSGSSPEVKMETQEVTKLRRKATKNEKEDRDKADKGGQQIFDGQTWSCVACKLGHRVKTCNHGRTKPISPTNPPGRPARGSKRKCDCPPACTCARSGPCTCGGGCVCVQKMWLIVYIDPLNHTSSVQDVIADKVVQDARGNTIPLRTVWTDSNGREISDEEYARRQEIQRERGQKSCCSNEAMTDDLETLVAPQTNTGCRQRQVDQSDLSSRTETYPVSSNDPVLNHCSCGGECQCIMCPEHPDNEATRLYNVEQVKKMMQQRDSTLFLNEGTVTGVPYVPHMPHGSCMGGPATYFFSRSPFPTQEEMHGAFPNGPPSRGLQIAYPMDAIHPHTQNSSIQAASYANVIFPDDAQFQPTPSQDFTFEKNNFNFDLASFPYGNPETQFTFGTASVNSITQPYLVSFPSTRFEQSFTIPSVESQYPPMTAEATQDLNTVNTTNLQLESGQFGQVVHYPHGPAASRMNLSNLPQLSQSRNNDIDANIFRSAAFSPTQRGYLDPMLSAIDGDETFASGFTSEPKSIPYHPSASLDFAINSIPPSDSPLSPSSPQTVQNIL